MAPEADVSNVAGGPFNPTPAGCSPAPTRQNNIMVAVDLDAREQNRAHGVAIDRINGSLIAIQDKLDLIEERLDDLEIEYKQDHDKIKEDFAFIDNHVKYDVEPQVNSLEGDVDDINNRLSSAEIH